MKVAIIGGGPAGSHIARTLAKQGMDVTVFNEAHGREKPCGGGVTYRIVREFPLLEKIKEKSNRIHRVIIFSPSDIETELILPEPILIFSRKYLDSFLLSQANESGARIVEGKVKDITQCQDAWLIQADANSYGAFDFLVGADGSSGLTRKKLSKPFQEDNLTQTLGFFIKEATDDCIRLKFYDDMEGYAWSFPRKHDINAGIGSPLGKKNPKELLEQIQHFIERYLPSHSSKEQKFFSALIPSINPEDSQHLKRISDTNWALIGDSCGITDPITGEGIYYAIKTSSLLSECLMMEQPKRYASIIKLTFGKDISWAYRNRHRFFKKEFIDAAVDACNKSKEISSIVSELFCGTLPYRNLSSRLLKLSMKVNISLLGKLISYIK